MTSAQRSNGYPEFVVPIASLGRGYISSAPQSEGKAPRWAPKGLSYDKIINPR
jgi:hypothetical protein